MNRPARHILGMTVSGLALSVAVGIALGTGSYTYHYGEGFSYLSSDPRACVNCHIMRDHYDGWSKASHHAVATCNDCHTPHNLVGKYMVKAQNGFWHSFYFTTGRFPDPLRITERNRRVTEDACRYCHQPIVDAIAPSLASSGHGDPTVSCIRCHKYVGHFVR